MGGLRVGGVGLGCRPVGGARDLGAKLEELSLGCCICLHVNTNEWSVAEMLCS